MWGAFNGVNAAFAARAEGAMSGRRFANLCLFTLAAVIGGSISIAMLSAPHGEQPLRLLLITSGSQAERRALAEGARAAAEECGVELAVRSIDPSSRASLIEATASVIADGIHGAIVSQAISDDVVRELRKVSGVSKVITCGSEVASADRLIHVGTNQYSAGRLCGNLIKEALPTGGRIVVLVDDGDEVASTRLTALQETLASQMTHQSPRWELVAELKSGDSASDVERELELELQRHADVSCVIDLRRGASQGATAQAAAVAESHRVKFITFDQSAEALAAVETGQVYAVISDNAFGQGYQAVQHLASICHGNEMRMPAAAHGGVNVPVSIVRQGNVAEHRAQLAAAVTSPSA
jgi:ribose transport system substrate-binding protein